MAHRRPPPVLAAVAGFAVLVPLAACGEPDGEEAPPAAAVRDSAGIVIVENGDPAGAPEWTLSAPVLEIGSVDAEGPAQLFRVRAAATLPDGGVAIVNGGSGEVRRFGPDGAFVRSMGRQGEGPGEFGMPEGVWPLPGDSLMVWDRGQRRLTVFAADGALGRVTRLAGELFMPEVLAVFEGGDLLVTDERFVFPESGYVPIPFVLARYAPDGNRIDSLSTGVRAEMGVWDLGGGNVRVSARLFGAFTAVDGDPGGYWAGTAREYALRRHAPDGRLARIVRWQGPDREVTSADVDADLQRALDGLPESGGNAAAVRSQHGSREVAERFPAYRAVLAAHDGGAWVLPFARPRGDPNPRWLVFAPDGTLRARIRLPERFRPLEVRDGHVLGVLTDELEVERVHRYRVLREAPAGSGDAEAAAGRAASTG